MEQSATAPLPAGGFALPMCDAQKVQFERVSGSVKSVRDMQAHDSLT